MSSEQPGMFTSSVFGRLKLAIRFVLFCLRIFWMARGDMIVSRLLKKYLKLYMAENNNVFMIARGELKTDGKILKRTREIMENVCSNVKFLKDNGHEQESEV